jgi:hypothetical protein
MSKKRPLTATQINNLLKFRPEWIKDPVPPFRQHLDRATLQKIARAKTAFAREINSIVRSRAR